MRPSVVHAVTLATLFTATPAGAEPVASTVAPVIYGTDDRVDYYQITDPGFRAMASDSIVLLALAEELDFTGTNLPFPPFIDRIGTLRDGLEGFFGVPICPGLRFADQPAVSACSGTLVASDVVLTAGHCVPNMTECRKWRFLFDFHMTSATTRESIDADDVYSCKALLGSDLRVSPHYDWALVKLDRPVVGRTPVAVRRDPSALTVGTPVVVLGHGSGLPLKFDAGGQVVDAHAASRDTFVANTDTFSGNSGSGVFDASGTLLGVLVTGADDYLDTGSCVDVNALPESAAEEECTYAFRALDTVCDAGYPSSLCPDNPAPTCGDGYCTDGETSTTCAADCAGRHCPDGTCGPGENVANCPFDCGLGLRPVRSGCSVGVGGVAAPGFAAFGLVMAFFRRRRR